MSDSLRSYLANTFGNGRVPKFYGQDYLVTKQLYVRRAVLFRMDEHELKGTFSECLYSKDTINVSTSDIYVALEQDNHEYIIMALIQYLTDYFDCWAMYPCTLYVHESIEDNFSEDTLKNLFNGSLNWDAYFGKLPEREQRYVKRFLEESPPAYLDKIVWMNNEEPIMSVFDYNVDIVDKNIIRCKNAYDLVRMYNADVLLTQGRGAEYLYVICLPDDWQSCTTYLNAKQMNHINDLLQDEEFILDFDILILHTPPVKHRAYDDYVYDLKNRGLDLINYAVAIFSEETEYAFEKVALGVSDNDTDYNKAHNRLLSLAQVSVCPSIGLDYFEDNIELQIAFRRYDVCTATVFNVNSDETEMLLDLGEFLSIGFLDIL